MENSKISKFKVGDIIKIATRDPETKKVHAAPYEGIVISIRGEGKNKTFTVRKMSYNQVAVEKIFPFDSPAIEKITVVKENKVRRAKLYYVRSRNNPFSV